MSWIPRDGAQNKNTRPGMDQYDPSSGRGSNACKITRQRSSFNGIGEPPTISSSAAVAAAVAAAVRNATGLPLPRIPIRPADIALG